ncbi:MAG: DUF805 domain-containing protein [Proteobacteria bacterium]|nr:DUF805 domain-containing protein [Pseudomonadota bacterium]
MNYLLDPIKNCFNFGGISNRKEFWLYFLFSNVIIIALSIFSFFQFFSSFRILIIVNLAIIIALCLSSWSLCFRRVRDTGLSIWWMSLILPSLFVSIIGQYVNNLVMGAYFGNAKASMAKIYEMASNPTMVNLLYFTGFVKWIALICIIILFIIFLLPSKKTNFKF